MGSSYSSLVQISVPPLDSPSKHLKFKVCYHQESRVLVVLL